MPETAAAQGQAGQAPLEMTFVDATPDQSGAIHEKLRSVIERSDDINFTNPSDFLFSAQNFDVTLDTLASSEQRKSQKELIRRAMRSNDLEAIVVYKRKGDTLHLILLGPSGAQLEHYRSPIRQPTINDKQAIAVLKKIFKVLVPKVRTFRKNNPNADQANPQPQSDGSPPSQRGGGSSTGNAGSSSTNGGGPLESRIAVSVAPVFGQRRLVMDTADVDGIVKHQTPFFGAGLQLSTIFDILDASSSAFGATAFLEFAPFRNKFKGIDKEPKGTYFRSGGRFRFLSALSSTVTLFGQVGGESLNIGLASNSIYVGSTYFAISAGGGVTFRFIEDLEATLEADLMPTVLTNTNDGAFGPGGLSLGFSGGPELRWSGLSPWVLSASYEFLTYSPDHPRPTLDAYKGPASGTDVLHVGGASLGYQF